MAHTSPRQRAAPTAARVQRGGSPPLRLTLVAAAVALALLRPAAAQLPAPGTQQGQPHAGEPAAGSAAAQAAAELSGGGDAPRRNFGAADAAPVAAAPYSRRSLLQLAEGDSGGVDANWCSDRGLPDGPYAFDGACDRFVLCYGGLTYVFQCAECTADMEAKCGGRERLAFNEKDGVCDWPVNVPSCWANATTQATAASPPPPLPTPWASFEPPHSDARPPPAPAPLIAFRGSNGPAPAYGDPADSPPRPPTQDWRVGSGPGAPAEPTPPPADLPLDFRGARPYATIPGYGGGSGWPFPDPEELAEDLAGDGEGGEESGGGGGSGGSGGDDPCTRQAASGWGAAEYSALFEAPVCDGRGRQGCAAAGLDGRGQGAEPDAPNTLYSECPDGPLTGGLLLPRGYVAGLSVDAFAPAVGLRAGALASLTARVVCDARSPITWVDLFYSADASMGLRRDWVWLTSQRCTPAGGLLGGPATASFTSPTFFLPAGAAGLRGAVALRAQLRQGLAAEAPGQRVGQEPPACWPGLGVNDRDDMVLQLCPPKALRTMDSLNITVRAGDGAAQPQSPAWRVFAARVTPSA